MGTIGFFIALLMGLAIMAVFVGLWSFSGARSEETERMYILMQPEIADQGGGGRAGGMMSRQALQKVDKAILGRGLGGGTASNLAQADLKITVIEFYLIVAGACTLGGLLGFAVSRQPISALVAGVITFFIPFVYVSWRRVKRRKLFAEQLPEALVQVSGSLRAGYSIIQSLEVVTEQMPPPARDEFLRVVREVQIGHTLNAALAHLQERLPSDDLVMVTTSIKINQQVGGNLAEILDTVAETIRERVRIKREVEVLTAQQRISGYVLVALPIGLAAVLLILNPSYEMRLFTPGITLCIPFGALLSMFIGYMIMRRIVDIEV